METSVSKAEFGRVVQTTNFISTYTIARQFVDDCVSSYNEFWELIRRCQRHLQGERPVPFNELKKRGLAWVPNDNYLKATSKLQGLAAEQVDTVIKALMLCYTLFRPYDEKKDAGKVTEFLKDSSLRGVISSAIGYAFYRTLRYDSRCTTFFNSIEYPATAFGVGYSMAYDDDWFPEVIHPLNIACKPKSIPEDLPGWVIFHTMDAEVLWRTWEEVHNQQIKKDTDEDGEENEFTGGGWNLKVLQEVLWRSYKIKDNTSFTKSGTEIWANAMDTYQRCSAQAIQNTADITLAKIYYKELDGSLSVTYIPYNENRDWTKPWTSTNPSDGIPGILYQKNFKNYIQEEKLNFVRDSGYSETTHIEDYRGLAKFAVLDSIRYNETRNDIRAKSRLAGSPFFDKGNSQVGEAFKLAVGTGYCLMPDNFTLAPNQPSFDLQSGMAYLAFEENQYSRLTQQFDASAEGRLSSRPNKAEVQLIASEVNEMNSAKNVVKFSDYRQMFWQMLRRLCNKTYTKGLAAQGQKRFLEELGKLLPQYNKKELILILKTVSCLEITPIVGDPQAIMMMIQQAETPFARNRYKRMLMLVNGAPIEEVDIAVPLITDKTFNFQEERIARFENNDLVNTSDVLLSGTDDHIIHLNTHLSKSMKLVEAYQQQQVQVDYAFKYLTNLLAHSLGHLDLLMRDPSLNIKAQEFQPIVVELQKAKNQMQLAFQAQMEEQMRQAEQFKLDPETQADIQRKNIESAEKQRRTDENTINRAQNNAAQIELSHQQNMKKIENEHLENLTEIQLKAQTETEPV